MKTIGMIGGVSWESTHEYNHLINKQVNKELGGKHSAPLRIYSFDFEEIMQRIEKKDFRGIGNRIVEEAIKLEQAGAELLILCANTAHRWAEEVSANIKIPLIIHNEDSHLPLFNTTKLHAEAAVSLAYQ